MSPSIPVAAVDFGPPPGRRLEAAAVVMTTLWAVIAVLSLLDPTTRDAQGAYAVAAAVGVASMLGRRLWSKTTRRIVRGRDVHRVTVVRRPRLMGGPILGVSVHLRDGRVIALPDRGGRPDRATERALEELRRAGVPVY